MKEIKLLINKPLKNYKVGKVIILKQPLNAYWQNRIKDSKIDNCVSIVACSESSKKRKKSIGEKKNVS